MENLPQVLISPPQEPFLERQTRELGRWVDDGCACGMCTRGQRSTAVWLLLVSAEHFLRSRPCPQRSTVSHRPQEVGRYPTFRGWGTSSRSATHSWQEERVIWGSVQSPCGACLRLAFRGPSFRSEPCLPTPWPRGWPPGCSRPPSTSHVLFRGRQLSGSLSTRL